MKKKLKSSNLIGNTLASTAVILTACSQDVIPGYEDGMSGQIFFSPSFESVETRSEIITQKNLPHFYVTAFDPYDTSKIDENNILQPNFENVKVNYDAARKIYTSGACVWPEAEKEKDLLTFFGFYPELKESEGSQLINSGTSGEIQYKIKDFQVSQDIADQADFITAIGSSSMEKSLFSGITLPFKHQMSRIEVKAFGSNETLDFEFAGVRIGGIYRSGTFNFSDDTQSDYWSDLSEKGVAEYIYRKGDKLGTCGKNHHVATSDAFSIMGSQVSGNDNCAMLIPAVYNSWDVNNDKTNTGEGMYISVLMRIVDASPSDTHGMQLYPYTDTEHGADATKIPVVYLAVDNISSEVINRVYREGDIYYEDEECTIPYTLASNEEVKGFSWAALPVSGNWEAGKVYSYFLDYTSGVGIHEPNLKTAEPKAGDPVINDHIRFHFTVSEWPTNRTETGNVVPGS